MIISLISDVMGVIGLHLVVSFMRLLPSPPEIKLLIVFYTLFLLAPTTLDSTLMLRLSMLQLSNIISLLERLRQDHLLTCSSQQNYYEDYLLVQMLGWN